ncbi:MAG: ParB/RepB/Spo0J family partition protein [Nitrososphaerota archaeon]|nr:ParB/RepB/Spo0J family partition protein [Nitrososphaerota archaeon]
MLRDIPLSLIDNNPLNPRLVYDEAEIVKLSVSLATSGLLSPIMVRKKAEEKRYELVFGHRRVRAAKQLGWKSIRAEIKELSDEELLMCSMSENLARDNLSDYEKAKCFLRFKAQFNKTNAEIGNMIGYSEAHVNNYLRMLQLSGDSTSEARLSSYLHQISEHHARILLRIQDPEERTRALKIAVVEKMSVRDLQRMLRDLHGWFAEGSESIGEERLMRKKSRSSESKQEELSRIEKALKAEFKLPHIGDFEHFIKLCAFDMGFSYFSSFPPYSRYDNRDAIERKRNWFFKEGPHTSNIKDIRVQFYDNTAVATLMLERKYGGEHRERKVVPIRGSLVLIRDGEKWRIVHEHWSTFDPNETAVMPELETLPGQGSLARYR